MKLPYRFQDFNKNSVAREKIFSACSSPAGNMNSKLEQRYLSHAI